ncbi:hypothetical protein [Hyphobacterium sp.]|jgi:hypothetical protein|uniref:hypothetical protein n=1 Tax=Hyphobacterium sp. TaxID=2004662 RepID=UPI003BA9FE68
MSQAQPSDLDYLRRMAESGEQAPLIGGRFLVIWGGLAVIACIAHWAIMAQAVPVATPYVGAVWLVYGVTGLLLTAIFCRGLMRKPGSGSIGNRVNRTTWRSVGIGIGLYVAGVVFSVSALDASPVLFDSILTIALFGYAIAFSVTAALSPEKWLYGPAWISIAGAALSPAFYGRPELYLLVAAIIVFAAVLPGFRQMSREPGADDE